MGLCIGTSGLFPLGVLTHLLTINALIGLLGTLRQVALQTEFQARKFEQIAHQDVLTGLQNRRAAELQLDLLNSEASFSVALLDLDHFKALNDRYGHIEGDEALRHVARLIRDIKSNQVSGYRWGGEEFMLTFARMEEDEVRHLLRQLLSRLRLPAAGRPWQLTASVGFVLSAEKAQAQSAVELADQRLYTAKELGRDRIVGPEEASFQAFHGSPVLG